MYIVKLQNNGGHSVWNTETEAEHQAEVLRDHGYKDISVESIDIVAPNGQYFV